LKNDYLTGLIIGAVWIAVKVIEFFMSKKNVASCDKEVITMLHDIKTNQEILKEKIETCVSLRK